MQHQKTLKIEQTALIVIDLQEAFRSTIHDFDLIVSKTSIAVRGFQALRIPIIVTEQYPKGLGKTVEEIRLSCHNSADTIEKTAFSVCGSDEFNTKLVSLNVKQIVICGIEAHICVSQSAHDLLDLGYQIHLLKDCVSSRFLRDKHTGIEKMFANGVLPSNVEMSLFELLGDSKHESFKTIQSLVK